MAMSRNSSIEAEIVAETATCTVEELCAVCGADTAWITTMVAHGIIEPIDASKTKWQFTNVSALRAAKARRLERDLKLNAPGIAVVLDLLDEIERLKARLKSLGHQATEPLR